MNPREEGFLLLTSHLGNPDRRPLTAPQMRTLALRVGQMTPEALDRDLEEQDLVALGCGRELASRILRLLDEGKLLKHYLRRGEAQGCVPISLVSEQYPGSIRQALGFEAPGCLWAKGDTDLLNTPMIALVGSRDLNEGNLRFAQRVGAEAARQGYTLVSGNARGADQAAQNACLSAGGRVISVVADALTQHRRRENVLYLSELCYDEPFSAQRALSRNRCIHALGRMTFVAQSSNGTGGTWDGTVKNLRFGWSPVFVFLDGSDAAEMLHQMGAEPVTPERLQDFAQLVPSEQTFWTE